MTSLLEWIGKHAAEIIALCAVAFTAYQAIVQRRHNILSVKPHISTFTIRNRAANSARLQILIMNNGLGPAFINKFQVYLSGQPCEPKAAVGSALKGLSADTSMTVLDDDYAMPAGEVRSVLSVTFPCDSEEFFEKVADRLRKLDLEVLYSSAYGKTFVFDSRLKKASLTRVI